MDYTEYTKAEQITLLKNQVKDLERQHYEQGTFAEMAEAAATTITPAFDSEIPESLTKQFDQARKSYRDTALGHRFSQREAEQRIAALRALLSVLEGTAPSRSD